MLTTDDVSFLSTCTISAAAYGLSVRGAEYARFIDLRTSGNSYGIEHEDEE